MRFSQVLAWSGLLWPAWIPAAEAAELRDLIAGDSMPGWEIRKGEPGTWEIRDGVLHCPGAGELWGGGWVSRDEYTDFILDFEYKLTPGGNSGVYVRVPKEGHPSAVAIEVQLLDDEADKHKSLNPTQYTGSLYKIAPPSRRASKPAGEWNHMRVAANRDHIVIALNGETIVDATGESHPEILNRSPRGAIGFQNHHTPVWFRNIRFADLARDRAQRAQWFRGAKFGLFIHWGIYAVLGEGEWNMKVSRIPAVEYEKLAGRFNPTGFDAAEWVGLAKRAGQKYIVITTKHHDGFAMYDSKVSDYDIVDRAPFQRDPLKDLADECRKQGLRLGFYHSILDWHHPDYVPAPDWDAAARAGRTPDFDRYCRDLAGQVRELCTNYGPLASWWWDGGWDHQDADGRGRFAAINAMIRELQPQILINNRAAMPEDFDTPEQYVPPTGLTAPDGSPLLWESCITLTTGHGSHPPTAWWGYDRNETEYKTPEFCIRMLVDVVSKGGNLLLNVGPDALGRIGPNEKRVFEAIAAWMAVNSEAIYGTTASPFRYLPFNGRATVKGNKLYLHVFTWPKERKLELPGLKTRIRSAGLLGTDQRLEVKDGSERDGRRVQTIALPDSAPDAIASVIAVALEGAPEVEPYTIRPDSQGVVKLPALFAELRGQHGQRMRLGEVGDQVHISNWVNANDYAAWSFELTKEEACEVRLTYAADSASAGGEFETIVRSGQAEQRLRGKVEATGGTRQFVERGLGRITLPAGAATLEIRAAKLPKDGPLMELREIALVPAK